MGLHGRGQTHRDTRGATHHGGRSEEGCDGQRGRHHRDPGRLGARGARARPDSAPDHACVTRRRPGGGGFHRQCDDPSRFGRYNDALARGARCRRALASFTWSGGKQLEAFTSRRPVRSSSRRCLRPGGRLPVTAPPGAGQTGGPLPAEGTSGSNSPHTLPARLSDLSGCLWRRLRRRPGYPSPACFKSAAISGLRPRKATKRSIASREPPCARTVSRKR
jgi:hypothetical protein